jgi:hypothetical protein
MSPLILNLGSDGGEIFKFNVNVGSEFLNII